MSGKKELTDAELLSSDIRDLSPNQLMRRHDLLKSHRPIPGVLQQINAEEAADLLKQIKARAPQIIYRLTEAGSAYRRDRDSEAYDVVIFDVLRSVSSFCGDIGYDPSLHAFSELERLLWKEAGLTNID